MFGDGPQLPSPLGQAFATINNFKRLPVADRLSIAGLLVAMLDLNRSPAVYERYDGLDALTLFRQLRISERMINEFLRPILLVGLFKPPEELSAAVTMELLYYYALAHQDSFDVRWIRSKTIAEQLFAPLSRQLCDVHQLQVLGGTFAARLNVSSASGAINSVETRSLATGETGVINNVDAVVRRDPIEQLGHVFVVGVFASIVVGVFASVASITCVRVLFPMNAVRAGAAASSTIAPLRMAPGGHATAA